MKKVTRIHKITQGHITEFFMISLTSIMYKIEANIILLTPAIILSFID